MNKTVQYNGAKVTVKRGTVRSRLRATLLYKQFDISQDMDDLAWYEISLYVRFLTQVDIDGTLDFDVPNTNSDAKALQKGLEHFLDADNDFYDLVIDALNVVDATGSDEALKPDADPNA